MVAGVEVSIDGGHTWRQGQWSPGLGQGLGPAQKQGLGPGHKRLWERAFPLWPIPTEEDPLLCPHTDPHTHTLYQVWGDDCDHTTLVILLLLLLLLLLTPIPFSYVVWLGGGSAQQQQQQQHHYHRVVVDVKCIKSCGRRQWVASKGLGMDDSPHHTVMISKYVMLCKNLDLHSYAYSYGYKVIDEIICLIGCNW